MVVLCLCSILFSAPPKFFPGFATGGGGGGKPVWQGTSSSSALVSVLGWFVRVCTRVLGISRPLAAVSTVVVTAALSKEGDGG